MAAETQYLVRHNAQQYGPYTSSVLRQYYQHGQILGTDLVWTRMFKAWITAEELFADAPPGEQTPGGAARETAAPSAPSPDSPIPASGAEAVDPQRTRRLKAWVWAGAAAVIAAVVVLVVLLLPPKPEDSIDLARTAYLQRDQANFDKYIDVASVLSDGVDQIVGAMMRHSDAGGFTRIVIAGAVPALKSIYLPAVSRSVDQLIISGTLPQDPQSSSNDPAAALIASYVSAALHKLADSALSYQGVESKQVSGDSARLALRVATPLSAEPMVLKVRMQKANGYWRVVAVEDLAGLLQNLEGLPSQAGPTNSLPAAPIAPDTAVIPAPIAPAPEAAAAPAPSGELGPGSTDTPQPAAAASPPPSVDNDDPFGPGGVITPPDNYKSADSPNR